MLADRAEFAGHPSAGPQKFHAVARTAFGTNAFGRFLAETNRLDTLNPFFGVAVSLFCLHCQFSTLKVWVGRPPGLALADLKKNWEPIYMSPQNV